MKTHPCSRLNQRELLVYTYQYLKNSRLRVSRISSICFEQVIQTIADHSSTYAWVWILSQRPSYAQSGGSWKETNVDEMRKFIAVLLFMSLVHNRSLGYYWRVVLGSTYWSTAICLYNGLRRRAFFTRHRFEILLCFLHVDSPSNNSRGSSLQG